MTRQSFIPPCYRKLCGSVVLIFNFSIIPAAQAIDLAERDIPDWSMLCQKILKSAVSPVYLKFDFRWAVPPDESLIEKLTNKEEVGTIENLVFQSGYVNRSTGSMSLLYLAEALTNDTGWGVVGKTSITASCHWYRSKKSSPSNPDYIEYSDNHGNITTLSRSGDANSTSYTKK